ncbi:MAG TPA: hypothetical protein VK498_05795, partial [Ferruginibacter sp.]|nr:hypothetical protein [Ferruginibacter sp.]
MENNFYNDNFEQLLKEATDDFRMYPSRRVWHSIYNDLHPGKRWPSLAVCLLLISSVLYIGISNNNSINSISRKSAGVNIFSSKVEGPVNSSKPSERGSSKNNQPASLLAFNKPGQATKAQSIATIDNVPGQENAFAPLETSEVQDVPIAPAINNKKEELITSKSVETERIFNTEAIENNSPIAANTALNEITNPVKNEGGEIISATDKKSIPVSPKNNIADFKNNKEELAWIENYAFHNKSSAGKWKNKRSIQYYITPSIGYRHLEKNSPNEAVNILVVANQNNNRNINEMVNQNAAINLEAGTVLLFDVMKRVRLKSGIQFNYTNYISNTFELKHPTQTTILLNDLANGYPVTTAYSTIYANNTGGATPRKLNNKTIQLSIPVGADIKLAGKNNIKWYAGFTVQPTYIASGNVYMISTDAKNYIDDPSMLRKWNINGGFETFISYKTPSGISINAGPQFRYQFLST